jgi:glyoxylase-like metal-dependent hydrolase (beta-lactamase superfamily II)
MQVAPGVYAIRAVGSTAYLLGGIELTLVDAGGPGSAPRIMSYIRRLERQPQDLTRILLTHVDLDHAGGLAALVAATGAATYAHPEAVRRLRAGEMPRGGHGLRSSLSALRRLLSPVGAAPHAGPLTDGALLPMLGGLQAIYTGGHSPDHVVYFARQSRLLLAGDLLQVSRGHLQALPGPGAHEREQAAIALRRLADLDPLAVLPGHGPPYRNNIALRLARLAEIAEG